MNKTYMKILEEFGWPPIYLIPQKQFEMTEGCKVYGCDGIASEKYPVITIAKGLRGKRLYNTLAHELGHHLFPSWPHWKVEAFAERMAGGGGRGYWCRKYSHSVDEMPSRSRLLHLARLAAKRLKDSN